MEEHVSVEDAEEREAHEEDEEVVPDELDHTALPKQHQVPEATEPLACVVVLFDEEWV